MRFECQTLNCAFATDDCQKLFNHQQNCRPNTNIECKQVALHRPCTKVRRELVAEGAFPDDWYNWHFVTFDCECFMAEVETSTITQTVHRLVSIAIKSSFGENSEHYIQRRDMDPWSVKLVIQEFLSTLVHLRTEMLKFIPFSVLIAQERYSKLCKSKEFRKLSVEKQKNARDKLNFLNRSLCLRIYSWNGEKYDHNVVWAPLMDAFANMEESFKKFHIIRRGTGIMQFSDGTLIFRDFLNMTSPMSLDKFAGSCGVFSTTKTTFPYEFFRDISTLEDVKDFPSYECFRSSIGKNTKAFIDELETLATNNINEGVWGSLAVVNQIFNFDPPLEFTTADGKYTLAPDSVDRAKELLHTSPKKYLNSKQIFDEKCTSMAEYLKMYNLNDVILLEECVKTYAKGFYDTWGVNIHEEMSLPGVAQNLAFRFYDEKATAIYTFGQKFKEFNAEIRKHLLGGMTLATSF